MNDVWVGALAVALVLAVLVIGRLLIYRVRHPWTDADLAAARQDSLTRSHAVVSGKVVEHLAPLFPEFGFNPRDARFLGTPIDFVVFDGLDEGGPVRSIVFVEVKTGRATLSGRERHVRDAVEAGLVEWRILRLSGAPVEAADDLVMTDRGR
jgi:predicted Holliday junction resolvase-like endonuclease